MKTFELFLIYFAALSSLLHLTYYFSKYGLRTSISAYYYDLKKDKKSYLFRMFIFGIVVPILIVAIIEVYWLLIVACLLLSLVGIFPEFRDEVLKSAAEDKREEYLHIFGATGGILLAMFLLWYKFNQKKTAESWASFAAYAMIQKINYATYWVELTALIVLLSGLYNHLA